MNNCLNCLVNTKNPKFCSKSCAAIHNNKKRSGCINKDKTKVVICACGNEFEINIRTSISKSVCSQCKFKKTKKHIRAIDLRISSITNNLKKKTESNLLLVPFETLKFERIRLRVFLEQNKQCNSCKLTTWLDKDIPFELNHIDGDNKNNSRENLEAVCPNCHALTDTWRGRNKKNLGGNKKKVSNDELLTALIDFNWNMRQSLLKVGLAAKGGNYKRCHFLKREYLNIASLA